MLPHIKTADNQYVVVIDDNSFTFDSSHLAYNSLIDCIKTGDADDFIKLCSGDSLIENFTWGCMKVVDEELYYRNRKCHKSISDRVISMIKDGFDFEPMFNFLMRLYKNPSMRAIEELFDFMVHKGFAITNDGFLLAYKYVSVYHGDEPFKDLLGRTVKQGDFVDTHTRKSYRYNVGDEIYMPRNEVCDDHRQACGSGLHAGSINYVSGNRDVVIMAIDPADVVSIPSDCSCQKLRCCKYKVHAKYNNTYEKVVEDVVIE